MAKPAEANSTAQPPLGGMTSLGWLKTIPVMLAFAAVLFAPFALRPEETDLYAEADETLVIISPHNQSIRNEFSRAFCDYMRSAKNRRVRIDWRNMGGTSEITKYIDSAYTNAFRLYWRKKKKGRRWKSGNPTSTAAPEDDKITKAARAAFLESNVGIGVDLFFGGGPYEFVRQANKGHLADSGIFELEPEWFSEAVIPAATSGQQLYDANHLWVGSCLSSFGICYNTDFIKRLKLKPPTQWEDLGHPAYINSIALADPTKSGSVTTAFEYLIQQQLAMVMDKVDFDLEVRKEEATSDALDSGWANGLNLIQRIAANARYFTDSSTKIPFDVAQGNAAAGMSIDYYGRTLNEYLKQADGSSRIRFTIPVGGTAVGPDPIAMLRGAPNPDLALEFIRFVLSRQGQNLWYYRKGVAGGPTLHALRRLPIRKDCYTLGNMNYSSDPGIDPFQMAEGFYYHPEWTASHYSVIRFIVQVMCLETHEELKKAWQALIAANFPERATKIFYNIQFVGYTTATGDLSKKLREGDALTIQKRRRDLREYFRTNYIRAAKLANQRE